MESKFDKTAEILFELKISDVMERDIVSVSPEEEMEGLKKVLRDEKISGVPVVRDNTLVGIISLEDLIKWLDSGKDKKTVGDLMTVDPQIVYTDQPLLSAVKIFEKYGFGRCPVVDRENGSLAGIITKGSIIESVLKQLEKEFKEEEIRQYRASHFFKDISADAKEVSLLFHIKGKDIDGAGKASVTMKRNLKRMGVSPDIIQRIAIAAYEAEMNLVIYTDGGTMLFHVSEDRVILEVNDNGPGIDDVEKALQPGYSTAEPWVKELGFGAGMGLPNIKKCADKMDLVSSAGGGTKLRIEVYRKEAI